MNNQNDDTPEKKSLLTLIGASKHIEELREQITAAAAKDSTVLIQGETGTGKELVAQGIHRIQQERKERDAQKKQQEFKRKEMVVVDCATLTENLINSELFGHKKGSFTGATENKIGLLKTADGGTIFLDEVGNISMDVQAKLLRFLDNGEFLPVGYLTPEKSNARIIAATNIDLREAVKEGKFRADLFHRLNGISIRTEPLRSRPEDIVLLINRFAPKTDRKTKFLLYSYDFPGNVRELIKILEKDFPEVRQHMIDTWRSENKITEEVKSLSDVKKVLSDVNWKHAWEKIQESERKDTSSPPPQPGWKNNPIWIKEKDFFFKMSSLIALFYPEQHDDYEKIVEAYEIMLLKNFTDLTMEEIKREIPSVYPDKTIKEENIKPAGFRKHFGFDRPEKDCPLLKIYPIKIYPAFTLYRNRVVNKDRSLDIEYLDLPQID